MNRKLAYAFLLSAVTLFAGGLPGRAANAQDTGTGEAATGPKQASPKEAGTKAAAIGPQQVVDHLHATVIRAMKGGHAMGYEGRYKLLAPVILESYDIPYIAQLTLGSYWSTLSEAQRDQFIQVLQQYSIANYAAEFDSYNGGSFQTQSQQSAQPGIDSVSSTFTSGSGKQHQFNYLLRQTPKGWRIINVIVDGVSDLSLKRSQYAYVMKTDGFDALIRKLEESIAKLSSKNA
ncbi:MAG: ABC transporter substrate-binding protein [Chromatiaceae bacterium]|jgi:phospholipid transport system substrate-binding protein